LIDVVSCVDVSKKKIFFFGWGEISFVVFGVGRMVYGVLVVC